MFAKIKTAWQMWRAFWVAFGLAVAVTGCATPGYIEVHSSRVSLDRVSYEIDRMHAICISNGYDGRYELRKSSNGTMLDLTLRGYEPSYERRLEIENASLRHDLDAKANK